MFPDDNGVSLVKNAPFPKVPSALEGSLNTCLDFDVPIKVSRRITGWKVSQEENHKAKIRGLISLSELEVWPKFCRSRMPLLLLFNAQLEISWAYLAGAEEHPTSTENTRAQGRNAYNSTPCSIRKNMESHYKNRKKEKKKVIVTPQNFHLNMSCVFSPPSENSAFCL